MRKITTIIAGSSLILSLAPMLTFAAFHEALRQERQNTRQEIQQKRQELRQEVDQKRDTLRQGGRENLRNELQGERETFRKEAKEKREAVMADIKQKREDMRAEIEKRREQFKEEAKARLEELKKKLGEKRAERIENFFKKMTEKFVAALARLDKFADRIEERLNKAAEGGKDVAALREQLAQARLKITEAESALEGAKGKYAEAVKDPDFRVAFAKVREVIQSVAEKVKAAHRALVEVVNSTKGLGRIGGGTDGNATSTATSTP